LAVSILFSKFQTTKFVDQQLVFEESQSAHPHPSPQSLDPIPEPDEENTDSSQPQSEAPPDPASAISTPIPPRLLHPFNSKQLARPSTGQPATSAAAMRAIFEPRPPAVKKIAIDHHLLILINPPSATTHMKTTSLTYLLISFSISA
jgi:hypothetical protein